jgi:signal transduction histidine kinase
MSWRSLRLRLIAGGIAAILIALGISGAGLALLFERHVTRTISEELNHSLKQLIGGIDLDTAGKLTVSEPPTDPRFEEPLSGLYWQVSDDRHEVLRSRSLWDTVLQLAPDLPVSGSEHLHVIPGPGATRVLAIERVVQLNAPGGPLAVRVVVAADFSRIVNATRAFSWDLAAALAILGLALAMATVVQVVLGVKPLTSLRRGIADIRAGRAHHLRAEAPSEVQPLADELNELMDAQEHEIERSRGRAADLAHGLKTPLAALLSDAQRIRSRGEESIARDIEAVADVMRRHVDRELARARLRSAARHKMAISTEVEPLIRVLVETIRRTPDGARFNFDIEVSDKQSAPFERSDLAEVLGNLLENAVRYGRAQVRITAQDSTIRIEDDGPGIAPEEQTRVTERGTRLDERGGGAGLGLAIVQDVLDAYGWRLKLGRSQDLGGLSAEVLPKASVLAPAA